MFGDLQRYNLKSKSAGVGGVRAFYESIDAEKKTKSTVTLIVARHFGKDKLFFKKVDKNVDSFFL